MEVLIIVGGASYLLYQAFKRRAEPEPADGNPEGNVLPAPRFLYSDPAIWTSSPVDITYRPYQTFWGPNNDPRNRYLLSGGVRVVHSGYNPVVRTNQVWSYGSTANPTPVPGYTPEPIKGTGEKQTITSKTIFKE